MQIKIKEEYATLFPDLGEKEFGELKESLDKEGQIFPLIVNSDGILLDGHQRKRALDELGKEPHYTIHTFATTEEEFDFVVAANLKRRHLTDAQKWELAKKLIPHEEVKAKKRQIEGTTLGEDSSKGKTVDIVGKQVGLSGDKLKRYKAIDEAGRPDLLDAISNGDATIWQAYPKILPKKFLKDDYVVPPFSILDLKTKEAQSEKAKYQNRFDSGKGRDLNGLGLAKGQMSSAGNRGISVFHPLVCRFGYENYSEPGDMILDPFCGGSVRGIMAGELGRGYIGFDLRQEQIDENEEQASKVDWSDSKVKPKWITSDSIDIDKHLSRDFKADLVFTSPPYSLGLEHYSDMPEDLNNMSLDGFKGKYATIISKTLEYLKPTGWSIWTVSDARDKDGFYWGLDTFTTEVHESMGWGLWNTIIEADPLGTAPQRARSLFDSSKKVVRVHQCVLIYKWRGK